MNEGSMSNHAGRKTIIGKISCHLKNTGHIDLIFHEHVQGHICTYVQDMKFKPVAGRTVPRRQHTTDKIRLLKFYHFNVMSNEPKLKYHVVNWLQSYHSEKF